MSLVQTLLLLALTTVAFAAFEKPDDPENLARFPEQSRPRLSVDSTFPGYRPDVLADSKWIVPGEETTTDTGSADRLGNSGNTWVSAAGDGVERWVRLDWPGQMDASQVEIWWTQDAWRPRAFRVEYLSDESWVPVLDPAVWLAATERQTVITFRPVNTPALRVIQHAGGSPDRGLMAMQELRVFNRQAPAPGLTGARQLSPGELAAISPLALDTNIARLHEAQPGASSISATRVGRGRAFDVAFLADGDRRSAPSTFAEPVAITVTWPIPHVIDRAEIHFADAPPDPADIRLLAANGDDVFPVETALAAEAEAGRVTFTFEPLACERLIMEMDRWPAVSEVEVYRYMPAGPNVWPSRLTETNLLQDEILASPGEPSFAKLQRAALSMSPARALLGLKDLPSEVGVAWDGAILAARTFTFSFGESSEPLQRYRDTVTRDLIDGWRPGTIVRGLSDGEPVTETAFMVYTGEGQSAPGVFARIEGPGPITVSISGAADLSIRDRAVYQGDALLLLVPGDSQLATTGVGVTIAADEADLIIPVGAPAVPADYLRLPFSEARKRFIAYWDDLLAPASRLQLPEQRVADLYKAVLTQLFINANGDIMPYGSHPSVYDGNLYGVEESFAMFALAYFGFAPDAARYMDATYLHAEFLKKVEVYSAYPDRHQQYRNGLQPHYATSLYRLTRDREWISKHAALMRECAEWTIANRRKTMVLEDGARPLHWGLLPKWSYGGDIAGLQCYALYANFACWRGMADTAWLMEQLGDSEAAARYRAEADEYRAIIEDVVDRSYEPNHEPPFLPLRLYAKEPVGDDYYQLFAGILLDLLPFDLAAPHNSYLTDYMEQANLMFCGLPRFRRDAGPGGLDGLYSLGYLLTKLHQDKLDEFLLGFYAYLAFNMEHGTFASRETNLIYASDLHVRSKYRVPDISDPIPCSAAVPLIFLRHMLITEKLAGPGLPSGELNLLHGVPRAWLADGATIAFEAMPTQFGEVSCTVKSEVGRGLITAAVTPPKRDPWGAVHLRLRHPEALAIKSVAVNGEPCTTFDAAAETITLAPGEDTYTVVAQY